MMKEEDKQGRWLLWLSVALTAAYILGDMAGIWGPEPTAFYEYLSPLQP